MSKRGKEGRGKEKIMQLIGLKLYTYMLRM